MLIIILLFLKGSTDTPGLAVLAMVEFLSIAEKNGKSIAVSFYEVDHQDHAIDLINPEQPPISIFEGRGRIQFKGLTQVKNYLSFSVYETKKHEIFIDRGMDTRQVIWDFVMHFCLQNPVKSIAEFQNLYCTVCSALKAAPKKGYEYARRSHMGLIVYVFSQNESIEGLVSKMNFVDMAGQVKDVQLYFFCFGWLVVKYFKFRLTVSYFCYQVMKMLERKVVTSLGWLRLTILTSQFMLL